MTSFADGFLCEVVAFWNAAFVQENPPRSVEIHQFTARLFPFLLFVNTVNIVF